VVFRFRHPFEVQFRDLDALGHLNNVAYLAYIEHARLQYMTNLGLWSMDHPIMILARSEIDYVRQVVYGERVEVLVRVARLGTKSFEFVMEIHANTELAARASSVNVWYNHVARSSVPIPDHAREAIRSFELIPPLER
jgi:acyl-CoA thioester hydrolase